MKKGMLLVVGLGVFLLINTSNTHAQEQVFPLQGETQASILMQQELIPLVRAAGNGVFTKRLQKECLEDVVITQTQLLTPIEKLPTLNNWQEQWEVTGCGLKAWFIINFVLQEENDYTFDIQVKKE